MAAHSKLENTLAGRLGIEQLVGLLGIGEHVALGEDAIEVNAAIGDVLRALPLSQAGECPGTQ